MTRDDWYAYIESVPSTPNQLGRAHAEMIRLGVVDRAERLAITAALLDLDGLDSTADLTQGQAGYLVNLLQRTRDGAELPVITAAAVDDDQADDLGDDDPDGDERITWPEAIGRIIATICAQELRGPYRALNGL